MPNHSLTPAQREGWSLAALTAPAVVSAAGTPWPVTLTLGVLCGLLGWKMTALQPPSQYRKVFWAVEYLWAVFAISRVLPQTQACWYPERETGCLIPVTLLALAVCAALPGPERGGKAGAVIVWLLAGLYGWILVAGLGSIQLERVGLGFRWPEPALLFALLLPCAGGLLPAAGKRSGRWTHPAGVALAVAVSLWTAGILSENLAAGNADGFYQAVRGMRLFRTAQRFEAFLSVALTLGWFACLNLLLSLAQTSAASLRSGWGSLGVWIAAVAAYAGSLVGEEYGRVLDMGSLLAWAGLPLLAGIVDKKFRGRKLQKKA